MWSPRAILEIGQPALLISVQPFISRFPADPELTTQLAHITSWLDHRLDKFFSVQTWSFVPFRAWHSGGQAGGELHIQMQFFGSGVSWEAGAVCGKVDQSGSVPGFRWTIDQCGRQWGV
jgi:hypothetical protein